MSLELDVTQATAWERAAQRVEEEFGVGQGLVAPDSPSDLAEVSQARWDLLLA